MEKENAKVIIDPKLNVVYASFYLYGLMQVFGSDNIQFAPVGVDSYYSGAMCFLVCHGDAKRKVAIAFGDSYQVNEELYDWCDVYGNVNANFAKTPERFHKKMVALCPSFGIRLWNLPQTMRHILKVGLDFKRPLKKQLGQYKRMMQRFPYEGYVPQSSDDHYIFFLSTLWYNDEWNQNDNGLNARRANYIRACKQMEGIRFEGGLVSQGKKRSSEDLFSDCLAEGIPMKEWLAKTKRSMLVFNTPAFWDCHGWKLGEYLALGKCIVSTALSNDLPAPLEHGVNIHFVENSQEAVKEAVKFIIDNPDYRMTLEKGARAYWEQYGSYTASLKLLGIV